LEKGALLPFFTFTFYRRRTGFGFYRPKGRAFTAEGRALVSTARRDGLLPPKDGPWLLPPEGTGFYRRRTGLYSLFASAFISLFASAFISLFASAFISLFASAFICLNK